MLLERTLDLETGILHGIEAILVVVKDVAVDLPQRVIGEEIVIEENPCLRSQSAVPA